jgi:hypothetical protein
LRTFGRRNYIGRCSDVAGQGEGNTELTEIFLLEMFDPRGSSSMMHAPLFMTAAMSGNRVASCG